MLPSKGSKNKNWRHGKYVPMKLVLCSDRNYYWGNPSKPGEYRCTKCGREHAGR